VSEAGSDRARIEWGSRFEPKGASADDVRGLLQGVYKGGISSLRKSLGA